MNMYFIYLHSIGLLEFYDVLHSYVFLFVLLISIKL